MPTLDLSTYLADDALTLTGVVSEKHPDGKSYTIVSPSARTALRLQRVMQMWQANDPDTSPTGEQIAELVALSTDDEGAPVDFHVKLMGATYQQMIDDGVSADRLERITTIVVTHYGTGSAVARALVEQASGEAAARTNRATRRATKRTVSKTAGSRSRRASTAATGSARATTSRTSGSSTSPTAREGQAKAG